jgi:predicted CXXCH cytochrome family protein
VHNSSAAQANAEHVRFSWFSPGRETVFDCAGFDRIKAALGKSLLFLYLLLQCAFRGIGASEWHPGEMSCDSCHLAQQVNQTNSDQLVAEEALLCQGCHQNAVDASHPIGVKPGFPLPAEFPLNARGEITCFVNHAMSRVFLPR